jgi:hypothetical protein
MTDRNLNSAEDHLILPTAVDVVGVMHQNVIQNFRAGVSSSIELPSLWRLARIVIGETATLHQVRYDLTPEELAT